MNQHTVVNNLKRSRFEIELDGEFAYVDYRYYKGDIAYMHAFVPDAFRGQGLAEQLAIASLDFARTEKKKIMIYCPFISKYVKEHAAYHDLVDRNYHPTFLK